MDLTGRVALVTGAGRGFGWGIARALGSAGARVAFTDINEEELDKAVADATADGSEAASWLLDVADLAAFERVVDAVATTWAPVDILVHNAIFMPLIRFEDTSPESWWRQLQVSLGGLFNGCKAVWPSMKERGGGHIIGIASGSSVRGYTEEVTYCTAKHGQEGFMKALALEARTLGIALNTIGPGKTIKPTRLTWDDLERMPPAETKDWHDPYHLGQAFVWLASQPPRRFTGLRFDAGTIVDTLDREGAEFEVTPEKVTLYVDDFLARQAWMESYEA